MPAVECDNRPQVIYPAGAGPGIIVNTDTLSPAYIGLNSGLNGLSDQLPAQASIAVDGTRDIYGSTLAQGIAVKLQAMPGATEWANPVGVQVALNALGLAKETTQQLVLAQVGDTVTTLGSPAQDPTLQSVHTALGSPAQDGSVTALPGVIAVTGTPLLALSTVFANPGAQTFTAGQSRTYGPGSFGQISYEIAISLISNASETNPSFTVTLNWSESASGQVVASENWYLCGGPGSSANVYSGTGRAKGDTLTVTVTNNGTLSSGSCRVIITQSSRLYIKDDFRSTTFNGIPGTTNATWDISGNVILSTATNVGTATPVLRSMPMYCGTVRISAFTQTGTANVAVTTQGQAGAAGLSNNTVWEQNIPAAGNINSQFDMPRGQCILTLTNTGSATQQIGVVILISEQAV